MARYAVTFASNGPKGAGELRYAENDADRISAALRRPRCDFDVRRVPPGCIPQQVEDAIEDIAQACMAEDTFVVYFSGHGFIEKGSLLLMLDGTTSSRLLSTAIHVDSIIRSLRFCNARHKLLILDCCHAGMVFGDSRFKGQLQTDIKTVVSTGDEDSASFVTLLASDRLEKAREFDELHGSFMTATICDALESEDLDGDVDGDGAIDLRDLQEWLAFQARERNRTLKDTVPVPFIYGRERGRLYITRDPQDWPIVEVTGPNGHTFVPIRMLAGDDKHIWAVGTKPVTNAQYRRYWDDVGGDASGPEGCSLNSAGPIFWPSGFRPWGHSEFCGPDKPVVCVNLEDAIRYQHWLCWGSSTRDPSVEWNIFVVPPDVWDMAAFGQPYPSFDKRLWLAKEIHHKALAPADVSDNTRKPNHYGLYDLFGNVWEWTSANLEDGYTAMGVDAAPDWRERNQQLRGGGFLDDLGKVRPILAAGLLERGPRTRHCDIGFRLAAVLPLADLPSEIRLRAAALSGAAPSISELDRFPATA